MNTADKNIIETAISALERDLRTERTTCTVRGEEFPAIVYDGFPYAITGVVRTPAGGEGLIVDVFAGGPDMPSRTYIKDAYNGHTSEDSDAFLDFCDHYPYGYEIGFTTTDEREIARRRDLTVRIGEVLESALSATFWQDTYNDVFDTLQQDREPDTGADLRIWADWSKIDEIEEIIAGAEERIKQEREAEDDIEWPTSMDRFEYIFEGYPAWSLPECFIITITGSVDSYAYPPDEALTDATVVDLP